MQSPEASFRVNIENKRSEIADIFRMFDIDRALIVVILSRVASLGASALTLFVIAKKLSPVLQGYFYTFTSLLALQSFVELGFSVVLVQFASHEWSKLRLAPDGTVTGDPRCLDRLASLLSLAHRWYAAAGLIFVLGVGAAGCVFFSHNDNPAVEWFLPWLFLVPLAGIKLWIQPTLALLEGCGQVSQIATIRLLESLVTNISMWCALLAGAGLWISAYSTGASLVALFALLAYKYRHFYVSLNCVPRSVEINWSKEIWPMQWRLALSGIVNYFAFSLFTPVMFNYHGAVQAGQMGMTLTIIGALTSVAAIWVQAKVPGFGVLVARKDYEALDVAFGRAAIGSMSVIGMGSLGFASAIYLLDEFNSGISQRLLPFAPSAVFLVSAVLAHAVYCIFAYLRAHKKEPLVGLSVTASVLIGVLVFYFGQKHGPIGAAGAQLAVVGLFLLPLAAWLGLKCREEWHHPEYSCE